MAAWRSTPSRFWPSAPRSCEGGIRDIVFLLSNVGAGTYPSRFRRYRSATTPRTTMRKVSTRAMARAIRTTRPTARCPPKEESLALWLKEIEVVCGNYAPLLARVYSPGALKKFCSWEKI